MVEPPDFDPHLSARCLPEGFEAPHVGSVGPAGGEKDGTVAYGQLLAATSPDLAVQAPGFDSLVALGGPLPEVLVRKEGRHTHGLFILLVVIFVLKRKQYAMILQQSEICQFQIIWYFEGKASKNAETCTVVLGYSRRL